MPSFSTVKDALCPIRDVEVSDGSLKGKARLLSTEDHSEHSRCVWSKYILSLHLVLDKAAKWDVLASTAKILASA